MEYTLFIAYLLIILIFIKKNHFFKTTDLKSSSLYILFFIKLIAAYFLFLVYSEYYIDRSTADIFKYFDDSTWLYKNVFSKSPINYLKIIAGIHTDEPYIHYELKQTQYWFKPHETNIFNDNRTVIRFNLIIYLISLGYYHIHTLILCSLSFIGLTGIYKTFIKLFPTKPLLLVFCIYLVPSTLFWGSGILKESILLFSVGIFVYQLTEITFHSKRNVLNYIWIIISFLLLTITKTYVIITIIPSLIALTTYNKFKKIKPFIYFLLIHIIIISIGLVINHYNSNFNILSNLVYKQHDFLNVARDTHAHSVINVEKLSNNLYSFLHFSPYSLINGLFRPSLLEINSITYIIPGLESTFLIFSILYIILKIKKLENLNTNQVLLIYFSIFFSLLLALLIGLVVPVLGAIVRYRVPYLPFFFSSIFLLMDLPKNKLTRYLEKIICKS